MSILRRKAFYLGFRFFYYPKLIINVTKKLSAANWVGRPLYKNVSCDGIEKYKTPLGDENYVCGVIGVYVLIEKYKTPLGDENTDLGLVKTSSIRLRNIRPR